MPTPQVETETWRCQTCHEQVNPDECIVEPEYGYEGEAWGTMFRQPIILQALSPCCRDSVINQWNNFLPADMVRSEVW